MPIKQKRRKKGIQELTQDDLQLLNIYKQAYKTTSEDERLREASIAQEKTKPRENI